MFTTFPRVLLALLLVLAGMLAGRATVRTPPPRWERVTVTDSVFMRSEPDTVVTWRERILRPAVAPVQVAVAPTAGVPTVERFCAPAVAAVAPPATPTDSAPPPPATPADTMLLLRSGAFDGRRLTLWGVTNVGQGWTADYRVRAPLTWRAVGDSVLVQRERLSGLKALGRDLLLVGGGFVLGAAASELRP